MYGMSKHVQSKWGDVICCKKNPGNRPNFRVTPTQVVVYEDDPLLNRSNKSYL